MPYWEISQAGELVKQDMLAVCTADHVAFSQGTLAMTL